MRKETYEEGEVNYLNQEENYEEKLDIIQTQLAGNLGERSKRELEDYAAFLRIKIAESRNELPN